MFSVNPECATKEEAERNMFLAEVNKAAGADSIFKGSYPPYIFCRYHFGLQHLPVAKPIAHLKYCTPVDTTGVKQYLLSCCFYRGNYK